MVDGQRCTTKPVPIFPTLLWRFWRYRKNFSPCFNEICASANCRHWQADSFVIPLIFSRRLVCMKRIGWVTSLLGAFVGLPVQGAAQGLNWSTAEVDRIMAQGRVSSVLDIDNDSLLLQHDDLELRHHGPLVSGAAKEWINPAAVREFAALLGGAPVPQLPAEPEPKPQAMTPAKNNYMIDPGHGGYDSGAVSGYDAEKGIVLLVATKLKNLLTADPRFDGKVRMTREKDTFLELNQRAMLANTFNGGATLISIHANSGGGSGYEAFTTHGQGSSDPLATDLLNAYRDEFKDELIGRFDLLDR